MRLLLVASLLIPIAACDNAPSSDYPTSETGIFVDVSVDGARQAAATVGLTADNPALLEVTYLRLEGGDRLSLTLGGADVPLAEQTLLGAYQYVGSLTGVAGRAAVAVAYERADGVDALATRGTLPAEFDLAATATRFSRADGLQLIISGAGGAEELVVAVRSVEGCFEPFTERGPATASAVSIPAARFVLTPNGPATCNVDVTVRAVAHGTPDPAFGRGGLVTLSQVRTLALTFDR
jgi:hypothetical protein